MGAIEPGLGSRIEDYVREVASFKAWCADATATSRSSPTRSGRSNDTRRNSAAARPEKHRGHRRRRGAWRHRARAQARRDKVATRARRSSARPSSTSTSAGRQETEVLRGQDRDGQAIPLTAIGQLAVHGSSAGVPRLLLVLPAGAITDDVHRAVSSMSGRGGPLRGDPRRLCVRSAEHCSTS